jgi:hypothetical protein
MPISWLSVQEIFVAEFSQGVPLVIETLTAFEDETRVLLIRVEGKDDRPASSFGMVLPLAGSIEDGTAGRYFKFVYRTIQNGPLSEHVYKRAIDCRVLADTQVTALVNINVKKFSSEEHLAAWLKRLECQARMMATGQFLHCSFSGWYKALDDNEDVDFCTDDNSRALFSILIRLERRKIDLASVRSAIDRDSIRKFVVMYLTHNASNAQIITKTAWEKLFGLLFKQLGFDGLHLLTGVRRRMIRDGRCTEDQETISLPFEEAIRLNVCLTSGILRSGILTFAPTEACLSKQKHSIAGRYVVETIESLGTIACQTPEDLQNVISNWHVICEFTDMQNIPKEMMTGVILPDDHSLKVYDSVNELPDHIRTFMELPAKYEIRKKLGVLCAFIFTERGREEYFSKLVLQEKGKSRVAEVRGWIKHALRTTRSPVKRVGKIALQLYIEWALKQ